MFSTTIIGYTNAGKSTLLNALTKAEVLVEDKLFATLDPTTRKLLLPNRTEILLTDTVGFIKKLPHQLVDSFKSTLESARQADLLLHVVDASNPHFISFIDTVEKLLSELKIENKPTLLILNKMDKVQDKIALEASLKKVKHKVYISALNNLDMDSLLAEIERVLQGFRKKVTFKVPYQQMDVLNLIYQNSNVLETIYDEKLTKIKVEINTILAAKIKGMLR
jgi:GTP-binding protein HflX